MKSTEIVKNSLAKTAMVLLAGALVFAAGTVSAPPPAAGEEIQSSIARGGKLYDKWYKVIKAKKPKPHPSYPADKKYAKKADSNRCKECHGWDYRGKDGAYAKGKHYSGIEGIRASAGADPAMIVAILKDKTHRFGDKMDAGDFRDLANFVSKGQLDLDEYIDRKTKKPKGDAAKGSAYFNTICAGCHGKDGFKPKEMKPMGAQMGNPWEVMHKILNGQPGEQMPALRALDRQIVVDIMSHMTTLPKKR
ncbi:MAG: c-type cytochrome [Proteobacteria bacterium]|nr:c-type cytochrome [Pseudomonadota bacterium]